jgi:class 3 adenylate cyclase
MRDVHEPRYARTPDGVYLAYQVIGDGPIDLLYEMDTFAGLDLLWELPWLADAFRDLASFARLILYDRRGVGLSSRNVPLPHLETRVDDIRTVLDAAGSETAVLLGWFEAGAPLALLASTVPERVRALVWWNPGARTMRAPDYPWGSDPEYVRASLDAIGKAWGTEAYGREFVEVVAGEGEMIPPSHHAAWIRWIARASRAMATPDVAIAQERIWHETDIRGVLPSVHVPTLLMGPAGWYDDEVNYLADLMPEATVVLLPDIHPVPSDEWQRIHDEIRRFIGVRRPATDLETVLATVAFTDMVGSTERQASLGDRGWKRLVERHHALVRDTLGRWRGREADTAGDGFYATFDGPARAIRCALEIRERVRELGVEIRAGLHTGECELIDGKPGGVAVSIGARVAATAAPSEVLVTQTVKDLVAGSGLVFEDAGEHELKGVPDRWRLYRVVER